MSVVNLFYEDIWFSDDSHDSGTYGMCMKWTQQLQMVIRDLKTSVYIKILEQNLIIGLKIAA